MKFRAMVNGCDGTREYSAGDEVEGDSQHARVLLFNHLAVPLDEQAQRVWDEAEQASEEDWEAHPLASAAHWDRGDEARDQSVESDGEEPVVAEVATVRKTIAPAPIK